MITVKHKGDFKNLDRFIKKMERSDMFQSLDVLARAGAEALSAQTPKASGVTAASWTYDIIISRGSCSITWLNSNIQNGFNVAVGLQYGHGTGTGGWVTGYDYINPAMRPIMDKIAEDVWKVVTSA